MKNTYEYDYKVVMFNPVINDDVLASIRDEEIEDEISLLFNCIIS